MTSRSKIVQVAKSYIGVCGGSSAHADILHWFNTVKPDGYTAKKSDAWCAEFVSACAIQAFGKKTALKAIEEGEKEAEEKIQEILKLIK